MTVRILAAISLVFAALTTSAVGEAVHAGVGEVRVDAADGGARVEVGLNAPQPWRVEADRTGLRIFVADLSPAPAPALQADIAVRLDARRLAPPWTALELDFDGAVGLRTAEMRIRDDGTAALSVEIGLGAPESESPPPPRVRPVIAIDPGHGGRDPGAEAAGIREADLVLRFAERLALELSESGRYRPVLTRSDDRLVALAERVSLARRAEADLLISIHADALTGDGGRTSGATVYVLSASAGHAVSARTAARNAPTDILGGIDLTGSGEEVMVVLQDLARAGTAPQARRVAGELVAAFAAAGLDVASRPLREGRLAVLSGAEIPSILLELGFLSSTRDRQRLESPEWQDRAAKATLAALDAWLAAAADDEP